MASAKQSSKRKRRSAKLPVLGAAGLSLAMVGGASATIGGPAADITTPKIAADHELTLSEEELSDVSLATFYVFDKEHATDKRIEVAVSGSGPPPSVKKGCTRCMGRCKKSCSK
jgi:hypothetical protein